MDPIDERITAAQLMALRKEPNAQQTIAELLCVGQMAPKLALNAQREIAEFVETGDATRASQMIHAAMVRRSRSAQNPAA